VQYLEDIDFVVAGLDSDGNAIFIDPPRRPSHVVGDALETTFFWSARPPLRFPDEMGGESRGVAEMAPGESRFGLVCFPPRSAGKLDLRDARPGSEYDPPDMDRAMHATETIDYEVILSGKVDFKLSNGDMRTLTAGTCLVVTGAMHAWSNPYDEPCIVSFVAVRIGRNG